MNADEHMNKIMMIMGMIVIHAHDPRYKVAIT